MGRRIFLTFVDWFEVDEDMGESESEVLPSSNKRSKDTCDGSGGAIEDSS